MSPHLHYEIARARQQEIAASTIRQQHAREMQGIAGPRVPVTQRISQAFAALGTGVALSSPRRLARTQIRTP